ncbi:MAG: S-adenosylmethionine decarboxylase [Patescibacteria group bacterium]
MKNIAPDILRKRLLIEANYAIDVNSDIVKKYLLELAAALNLRTYGDPIIHSPSGEGKEENQGFDAFVPLIDSGISLYIWTNRKFMSCVLYTCKDFSSEKALQFTKDFFLTKELEHKEF